MKNLKLHLCGLLMSTLFVSCEKTTTKPTPTPTPEPIKAVNVLNDNSGYTAVYDSTHSMGAAYGQLSSIGVYDFTIENGTQLNLAYFTEMPTQQDPLITSVRISKNLNTGQFVPLPGGVGTISGAANKSGSTTRAQFFQYTNLLCKYLNIQSGGFGSNNGLSFLVDVSGGASSPNPCGIADVCFRHVVGNSGAGFGYFSKGANLTPSYGSALTMFNGAIGSQAKINYFLGGTLHEVYTGNGANEFFAIGVAADSVKVFKFNYTSFGTATTYPVYTYSMIQSAATKCAYVPFDKITRHYSSNGKTLSFMLNDANNLVSTYVYNFETNTLSQNLKQATLEYSGTGSDMDLDENGDVYYTGYAGNGSNTNGVSIYKKSGNAAPVLVGTDNILKFGEVIKLRILNGKVYFAVTGKQSGKDIYQLSLIKQN